MGARAAARAAAACLALVAMTAAADATFQEVRGARLYTQTFGRGAPILFLHGGLYHFDNTFARQRDYFAASRRVIGVDQRGHGHSPDTDAPLSYREMAEDTAALIERLGTGPVDVVGHSDGGNVGLLLASRHPGLVRRLVVSGANLRAPHPAAELERRGALTPQQIVERLGARARDAYTRVSPDGEGHWPVFAAKSWRLWLTPVIIEPAELAAIRAPVLVIAGDRDIVSLEETLEIYRGVARGRLLILPATGHMTFEERADTVNAAIRDFLEQPDRTTGAQ
jgi:pimeloyl-ACP methyl ester carboxylesterase